MDPFKFLIDSGKADLALLKKTYLSLAKKIHPDVDKGDPEATRRMQELNAAYESAVKRLTSEGCSDIKEEEIKPPEPDLKKIKNFVLHICSVVDDYLRYISRSVSISTNVKDALERIERNLICLEEEEIDNSLKELARTLRQYIQDPVYIRWLSDLKARKELEEYAQLRENVNLFIKDLFLENRRLFVRIDLHELATLFVGRLKNLILQAKEDREKRTESIINLCGAIVKSLSFVLTVLKEYHQSSIIL